MFFHISFENGLANAWKGYLLIGRSWSNIGFFSLPVTMDTIRLWLNFLCTCNALLVLLGMVSITLQC